MPNPWFAGIPPVHMIRGMRNDPESWGAWLSLTDHDAHHTMMLIEVEALRQDTEIQLFLTEVFIEGPSICTSAWSIAAKATTGDWHDVQ